MPMLNDEQLSMLGLASYGKNVQISDKASIYGASRIHIGNNVRIDDFCVLSAGAEGFEIGNYVHIAVFASIIGAGRVHLDDYSSISSRVSIYSSNDDYSGEYMANPTVPSEYTNVTSEEVYVGKHAIVGSGSVLLPGTRLNEGVAIGALSFVRGECDAFFVYSGNPARRFLARSRKLLELEEQFMADSQRAQ